MERKVCVNTTDLHLLLHLILMSKMSKWRVRFLSLSYIDAKKLIQTVESFLDSILNAVQKMPYGIRYIAQRMREHMQKKFPDSSEEIGKIVGNLIYYRYINPAIV